MVTERVKLTEKLESRENFMWMGVVLEVKELGTVMRYLISNYDSSPSKWDSWYKCHVPMIPTSLWLNDTLR